MPEEGPCLHLCSRGDAFTFESASGTAGRIGSGGATSYVTLSRGTAVNARPEAEGSDGNSRFCFPVTPNTSLFSHAQKRGGSLTYPS